MFIPNPSESGGDFAPVPAGTHLALCYRVIDLGRQKSTFQGEEKVAHKIMISWELPDERMEDGRPFTIHKRYTWSMHEKASLRKDLEAWRGAPFKEADFGTFDIRNVLGKACIVSVVQDMKPDGKIYANVAGVGKVMKNLTIPPMTNDPVYLWVTPARWDQDVFNSLSDGLKRVIVSSPEYDEMMVAANQPEPLSANTGEFVDDEVPFFAA